MGNKGLKYDNIFFPVSDLFNWTRELEAIKEDGTYFKTCSLSTKESISMRTLHHFVQLKKWNVQY